MLSQKRDSTEKVFVYKFANYKDSLLNLEGVRYHKTAKWKCLWSGRKIQHKLLESQVTYRKYTQVVHRNRIHLADPVLHSCFVNQENK